MSFGRDAMVRTIVVAMLVALPSMALAQVTYRCTDSAGKKYYGSTIPMQCVGHPDEQLNSQGMVVRRIDPVGDEKARAEQEAAAVKAKDRDAASNEGLRCGRAVLATYTRDRGIEEHRTRALEDS